MPESVTQKYCRWCVNTKPLDDFYTHPRMLDGHLNKCKECVRSYQRHRQHQKAEHDPEWRDAERTRGRNKYHRLYAPDDPLVLVRVDVPEELKQKARSAFAHAIRVGTITRPDVCETCGKQAKVHGHHTDYEKPFDVEWLCPKCHQHEHRVKRSELVA